MDRLGYGTISQTNLLPLRGRTFLAGGWGRPRCRRRGPSDRLEPCWPRARKLWNKTMLKFNLDAIWGTHFSILKSISGPKLMERYIKFYWVLFKYKNDLFQYKNDLFNIKITFYNIKMTFFNIKMTFLSLLLGFNWT